ncbi:MAG: hypothetical protein CM1200mP4_3730 [Rhodospirillaceae bacterium]|nr:MAG: hypothetical protein CM1200mP4_3730 [Rhodospirillaceae bacterium]
MSGRAWYLFRIISCPSTNISPEVGSKSPSSMARVVLFPAPLPPKRPIVSPAARLKLTFLTCYDRTKFLIESTDLDYWFRHFSPVEPKSTSLRYNGLIFLAKIRGLFCIGNEETDSRVSLTVLVL